MRASGLMRAEQSPVHHSSPATGVPLSSTMTPIRSVRPDDHRTLLFWSSTLNRRKARRKPTPDGNLWPVLLITVTRALRTPPWLLTAGMVTVAVLLAAWSSIAPSDVGIESMPFL